MGYSNNKWRKILTILMIINLCFVLFAKFTKVFGVTTYSNILQSDIEIPNWLYDHSFNVTIYDNGGGYFNLGVNYFDDYKVYYNSSSPDYYVFDSRKTFKQYSKVANKTNILNYLRNLTPEQFVDQSNVYIMSNMNNKETFYNFKIYDYNNRDTVYKDPNTTIINNPHFDNVTEIENGYPDGVFISRGSYSEDDNLYFHLLKIDYTVVTNNETVYYYSPKVFMLNKDSKYYRTYGADVDNDYSYYYVNRYYLNLDPNARYLYVLSNSSESFNNSVGLIEEDSDNGVYHVVSSNTTGVVTSQDSTNDKIQDIEDNMTDTTPDPNIDSDISSSFNYDNSNTQLDNAQGGFFSRLMALFSSMYDYDITEVTTIRIPLPNTQKVITLRSDIISAYIVDPLKSLITAFWAFVFYMYGYKFLNYVFIEIKEGKILDGDSLNNCPGTLHANIL